MLHRTFARGIIPWMALGLLGAATANAATIFVKFDAGGLNNGTSWDNAFTNLLAGLAAAQPGDEVWVAAGTYHPANPAGDRSASFVIGGAYSVLGGFAGTETMLAERSPDTNVVILSGDLNDDDGENFANNSDNSRHVVSITAGGATLDGVTIQGGNADGAGNDAMGGGMLLSGVGPTLRSIRFVANRAAGGGGGLACLGASPQMERCFFVGNHAAMGGGAYLMASTSLMARVEFHENTADDSGGGLHLNAASPNIVAGWWDGNMAESGGGLYVDDSSLPTIASSIFNKNMATTSGGAAYCAAEVDFGNCTIVANVAGTTGGGISAAFGIAPSAALPETGPLMLNAGDLDQAAFNPARNLLLLIEDVADDTTLAVSNVAVVGTDAEGMAQNEQFSNPAVGSLIEGTKAFATITSITATYTGAGPAGNPDRLRIGVGSIGGVIASPTATNSILWNNMDANGMGASAQFGLSATGSNVEFVTSPVRFCDVQGLSGFGGGAGNIDADPKFVGAPGLDMMPDTADDFYLAKDSPCIDAGSNSLIVRDAGDSDDDGMTDDAIAFDYDLSERVQDDPTKSDTGTAQGLGIVDMGAFERQGEDCDDNHVLDATQLAIPGADANNDGILDACQESGNDNGNANGNTNDNSGNANTNENGGNDNSGNDNTGTTPDMPANQDCAAMCAQGMMPMLPFTMIGMLMLKLGRRRRSI